MENAPPQVEPLHFPSAAAVRAQLMRLSVAQVERLAALSGVPYATLTKIRYGVTKNPGIETLRQFGPHIAAAQLPVDTSAAPAPAPTGG